MTNASLPQRYFEDLYSKDPDPWRFASSRYERDKYGVSLAALPRARYRCALEVGCSIGVMTSRLAERCEALAAIDVAEAPLSNARRRCAHQPWVTFARLTVPGGWPRGRYDLIVLSEVLYYLDGADIGRLARRVETSAVPGAHILLVHWTGPTDYPLSGDAAAEAFISCASRFAGIVRQTRAPDYRLDALERSELAS